MKKRDLEITLQKMVRPNPSPDPALEQYPTPPTIAADILFLAYSMGDIADKKVIDLGCGTGVFSLGAKMLGALRVTGIDVDEEVVQIARMSADEASLEIDFKAGDVGTFDVKADCAIQNPPFGSQKKHADVPFIEKALELCPVVYSMHMTDTADFIGKKVGGLGAEIDLRRDYRLEIPHMFRFHTKEKVYMDVSLFRICRTA